MTVRELLHGERTAQEYLDRVYVFTFGWENVDRGEDRAGWRGYDAVLRLGEKSVTVEEKIRRTTYNDILVELMDGVAEDLKHDGKGPSRRHDGWLFYCRADRLAYVWCNDAWVPRRLYIAPFDSFRQRLFEWLAREKRGEFRFSVKGDRGGAFNIVVPLRVLGAIGQLYDLSADDIDPIPF